MNQNKVFEVNGGTIKAEEAGLYLLKNVGVVYEDLFEFKNRKYKKTKTNREKTELSAVSNKDPFTDLTVEGKKNFRTIISGKADWEALKILNLSRHI